MNLIFKNVGRFSEEISNRYEAKINENLIVRVAKSYYTNQWNAEFLSKDLYSLDSNSNFDYFYSDTKGNTIYRVLDCLKNELGFLDKITKEAINLNDTIKKHLTQH